MRELSRPRNDIYCPRRHHQIPGTSDQPTPKVGDDDGASPVAFADVELSAAERRAILREHVTQLEAPKSRGGSLGSEVGDDVIDDALYEKRGQLLAAGLDTGRIDAVIERRKQR